MGRWGIVYRTCTAQHRIHHNPFPITQEVVTLRGQVEDVLQERIGRLQSPLHVLLSGVVHFTTQYGMPGYVRPAALGGVHWKTEWMSWEEVCCCYCCFG